MAYQPVPNTIQLDLKFVLGETNAQNSYYVKKATTWSVADIDDMIDAFESWWIAGADSIMSLEGSLRTIRAVDLTSLDTQIRTKTMDHPGGSALPAAPVNSSFAFKFDTGKRGRGRAGRIFYPFLAEDAIDAVRIPANVLTPMLGYFNNLITVVPGAVAGASWVVVHRVVGGVRLPTATTDPVLSVVAIDAFLDSQKNRLPFHKRQKRTAPGP